MKEDIPRLLLYIFMLGVVAYLTYKFSANIHEQIKNTIGAK